MLVQGIECTCFHQGFQRAAIEIAFVDAASQVKQAFIRPVCFTFGNDRANGRLALPLTAPSP